jgi:hypothetical protein
MDCDPTEDALATAGEAAADHEDRAREPTALSTPRQDRLPRDGNHPTLLGRRKAPVGAGGRLADERRDRQCLAGGPPRTDAGRGLGWTMRIRRRRAGRLTSARARPMMLASTRALRAAVIPFS